MHFEVLGHRRTQKVDIELVQANVIDIKRRPNQVFTFKDATNFVDALIGHGSIVIYKGKDSEDSEQWKAYCWEARFEEAKKGYGTGDNILPYGSLAVLEMESEYDLDIELETRSKETRRWTALWNEAGNLSRKISRVDDESPYADADRFRYMTSEQLEKVVEEMKKKYGAITELGKAEV